MAGSQNCGDFEQRVSRIADRVRVCYALYTRQGLDLIEDHLRAIGPKQADALVGKLRIGLHRDVEVTDAPGAPGPVVSQAFCSALLVAYERVPQQHWAAFAQLVLDAAYEATLLAGYSTAGKAARTLCC